MPQIYTIVQKLAPGAGADGTQKQVRSDAYGALHVRNELLAWVEEAAYFKACNPTFGTGIGMGIQTTFSDTANVLLIMRNGSASKIIIPHYIRLVNTVAGASTTSAHLGVIIDTGNRYSTGGTDLSTQIVNARSDQSPATAVDVLRFAAVTALAAVAKRQIARAMCKTQAAPCWVVGDELRIMFGEDADMGLISGAAAGRFAVNVGPVILGTQNHCLLIHQWNVANATTAPSWEVEIAWWEK